MRILIVTQIVDRADPSLGFFHGWIEELAKHFEHIHVICLKKGEYTFPSNVAVRSLGKEEGVSRLQYVVRFFHYAWKLYPEYDAVFVHMNQEYVLLGGWLWKLLRKPVYLWRNHYMGNLLTDIAALFAQTVFATSEFSYTAKYKKTVLMPVGVDTNVCRPLPEIHRKSHSILFFGRLSASKRPELLLEALGILTKRGVPYTATLCGPGESSYIGFLQQKARALGIENSVRFLPGIPHIEIVRLCNEHEVFINLSPSGMYDKTMFEAGASGCVVLAVSKDFATFIGERFTVSHTSPEAVAENLRAALALSAEERARITSELHDAIRKEHSLVVLGGRIMVEMSTKK